MTDPQKTLAQFQCAAAQNPARATYPLSLEELAADAGEFEPTDLEVLDVLVETFGLTHAQAIERLSEVDLPALRAGLA